MSETSGQPVVSVVIPTLRRPELLVRRALRSALSQTLANIEVVVVIDGPDPDTAAALERIEDDRLRVVALPENVGGSEARNVGVRAARSEWIALLDDDDEWFPTKLERQLEAARHSASPLPVVVGSWVTRTPRGDTENPPRFPDPGESIGDYMLARRSAFARPCGFMSSVIFTRRQLLLDVPFTKGLPKQQDWDWVLRAAAHEGVGFEFVSGTTAVWYFEEAREHMSRHLDWRAGLTWAQEMLRGGFMSERAYVGFINSHLAPYAQKAADRSAMLPLLSELLGHRPRPFEVGRFLSTWMLPLESRRRLRAAFDRSRRDPGPASRPVSRADSVRAVESKDH
ncbi:glycosyltransferase family 2 protein [Deinococcus pimensis]|uniref:glycosyltransferase family 2 protein n=1 Tax=Deinococcus pimensis TaxID=309888 RepID=UPI0004BCA030|nr:glycosyltransferase [Deinococcus pimensis]